jgi:site-specific recombinase XerD
MASVHQRKEGGNWLMAYAVPTADGRLKRVLRSSGTLDRSIALSMALACERAGKLAKAGRFQAQAAQRLLQELSLLAGSDTTHTEPIEAFLSRWLEQVKASSAKQTVAAYEGTVRAFLSFLGASAHGPLSEVSPGTISAFKSHLLGRGMSSLTVSQKLGVLRQAFREGVTLGAWTRNPADGISVEGASKRKRQSPKKAFTREQVDRMLSMAPSPEWRLFLSVLVWTGARQQ